MERASEIYRPSIYEDRLNQCEILSNISQFIPIIEEKTKAKELIQPFGIILTQDCDLNSDFLSRRNNDYKDVEDSSQFLPSVVLLELDDASLLSSIVSGSDIRKRIVQNQDIRYQYLRNVDKKSDLLNEGLPSLYGDFKRIFTIRTCYLYKLIQNKFLERRCIVNSPYLEEISTRFANFLSRIATPEPHYIKPK